MSNDFFNSISKLREANHLSLKQFAELFDVSVQAVQKWENGASHPSIANLIAIAKHFNVSVDTLLLESDGRMLEKMRSPKDILPNFAEIFPWESYSKHIDLDYLQTLDEGYDIACYRDLFTAVAKMPDSKEREQIADVLFNITLNAPKVDNYPHQEPSDLAEIRALRDGRAFTGDEPDDVILRDKIKGAWYGRICGCLLGKPMECMRTNELYPLLKEMNNYPLHRYMLSTDLTEEMFDKYNFRLKGREWADTVPYATPDDDTNYIMAQHMINRVGQDFTPMDVCTIWISSQSRDSYCTAEHVAYKNIVNGYMPPNTAMYKNPYREWIGAQIRADYYGYINPGDPEMAADMAWRDASISHIKNGIYGSMFVAAMLACAAVKDDIEAIIAGGLSQIPSTSRLYKEITALVQNYKNGTSCEDCFEDIHARYNEYSEHGWCHVISNAMIVTAALLYGEGDYGRSICLAVQTGFDTDCNGATVGSIVGMQKGSHAIGEEWTAPVRGVLDTTIFGVGKKTLDELIDNTITHIKAKK